MTSNVQISGKANNGIIFVVGGEDVDALRVNLSALLGGMQQADAVLHAATKLIVPPNAVSVPSRDEFQQAAQNVQNAFTGSQPYTPPADDPWGPPPQQNQQRQATPPPGQRTPSCIHGERRWTTGVTKSGKNQGKTWKAWFCPSTDRDDQCEAEWVR